MPGKAGVTTGSNRTLKHMLCTITGMFVLSIAWQVVAVDRVEFSLGRIEYNNVSTENVAVEIAYGTGKDASLHITVARLLLPRAGDFEQLEIDCKGALLTATVIRCRDGSFQARSKVLGNISGRIGMDYHLDGSEGRIALSGIDAGEGGIAATAMFNADGWHAAIQGKGVELPWLRKTLETHGIWPANYSDESGSVDINVTLDGNGPDLHAIGGVLRAQKAGFYGTNAAEDFSGEIHFDIEARDGWHIQAEGDLEDGAVFVEPGITIGNICPGIALELSKHPLRFSIDTTLDDSLQQVAIRQLDIEHAGVMAANVQAVAIRGENVQIQQADVALSTNDTGKLYTTWLQPFLLDSQFSSMETAGALKARAGIRDNALGDLHMVFDDVHAYDGNGRFHIAGLDGSLTVNAETTPVTSTLSWIGAGIYRLDTGAAKLELVSSNREVNVVSWEDVPVLGGELRIDTLNVTDFGREDMTIRLDGELTPIAMADFTRAMNWPLMSGELTSTIKGLTYKRGNLEVNGQINVGLFDGNVVVRNLSIEDLFGLVPVLKADIDIRSLDLELLTNRFSFGYIQGRLGGKVHKLELQAWRPVYFEAELMTPEDDDSRHRISQQAVDNLGYLGGGAINALSKGFLRFFQEYSYGRLGISCRLINGVCELGGVRETDDGFIIVSRGGLFPPWIEVIGTGHSIAWPVLVQGLKTISTKKPEIK
ncbi:MAG TPA: hypothetical protein VLN56_04385 [Gammaproteobacteria bacterium]|nr:hypothetical protein [Gammaproteobacteria bacterium]